MLAYPCAPVEFAEQSGKLWRDKLSAFLTDRPGHRVYDPVKDQRKNLSQEEIANFQRWKMNDMERFRRVARKIIAFQLELIEHKADYLIGNWNSESVRDGGMIAELTAAHRKGIPVFLVASAPVEEISAWALGCSDQLFTSIENLKLFLAARFLPERQSQLWKK